MGTGSAFNMKSFVYICLYLSTLCKIVQNFSNILSKMTPQSSTIDQQSTLETPWTILWTTLGSKTPPKSAKRPQETIKIHQRGSKRVPRGSQRVPRGSQRVPNRPPNDPKMTPERAQEDLGNLKSEHLLKH